MVQSIDYETESVGDKPFIPFLVGNKNKQNNLTFGLYDTGANINCMSKSFYESIKHNIYPLDKSNKSTFSAANGASGKIIGTIDACISFINARKDGQTSPRFMLQFHICSTLQFDVILGTPFTRHHAIEQVTKEHLIITTKRRKKFYVKITNSRKLPIISETDRTIPPNTVSSISQIPNFRSTTIFEYTPTVGYEFHGYSKIYPIINCAIVNQTNEPIHIKKGDKIANISPIHHEHPNDVTENLFYLQKEYGKEAHFIHMIDENHKNEDLTSSMIHRDPSDFKNVTKIDKMVNNISFTDKIRKSSVLNPSEQEIYIRNYEKTGIGQLPMSDAIEENDKNMTTMDEQKEEHSNDPLSKIDLSHLTEEQHEKVMWVLNKNKSCFAKHPLDTGRAPPKILTATLPIKEDAEQYRAQKFYPLNPAIKTELQSIIDKYLEAGILEFSNETPRMISNLLAVKKRDGSLRLLCDLRLLNSISKKLTTPHLKMCTISDMLQGNHYRSSFDLSNSFFQINVDPEDRSLLCFRDTNNRLLRYTVLPQGHTASPYWLSQLASIICDNIPNTLAFVDDFFIANKTFEEHIDTLDRVLSKLIELNLKIRPDKLQILQKEITFLSYTFKANSVCIPELRIKVFLEIEAPTTAKKCLSMIQMLNYYRAFIPDFTHSTKHMRDTYKAPGKFRWTPEAQQELDDMKKMVKERIHLQYVDYSKDFICFSDASRNSIAFSVFQKSKDDEKEMAPVAFAAKTLSVSESGYSANKLETLSIVWGLGVMDMYLRFAPSKILLRTDCRALEYIKATKDVNPHMMRLFEKLMQYKITCKHIAGKDNALADFYSRMNIKRESCRGERTEVLSEAESNYLIDRLNIPEGREYTYEDLQKAFKLGPLHIVKTKKINLPKKDRDIHIPTPETLPKKKQNIPPSSPIKRFPTQQEIQKQKQITEKRLRKMRIAINNIDKRRENPHQYLTKKPERITRALMNFRNEATWKTKNEPYTYPLRCNILEESAIEECFYRTDEMLAEEWYDDSSPIFPRSNISINAVFFDIADHELQQSFKFNNTGKLFDEDILERQQQDPECQEILRKIQKLQTFKKYTVNKNGIIGKQIPTDDGIKFKALLPKDLLIGLINSIHYGVCHVSGHKIYLMIDRHFVHPNLLSIITSYLRNCYACYINKPTRQRKPLLEQNITAKRPRHIIATDYCGEFNFDDKNHHKLMIFLDEFTGYVVAYPCEKKDTETSIRLLKKYIHNFGPMPILRSDGEKSLASQEVSDLLEKYDIEHIKTCPRNPNGNPCETMVGKMKELIRTNLHLRNKSKWSEYISDICYALNNTPQTHGYTPTELLWGESMINPYEIEKEELSEEEQILRFQENLKYIRQRSRNLRDEKNEKQRDTKNIRRKEKKFDEGDIVFADLITLGKNSALKRRRKGPYEVIAVPHPGKAIIKDMISGKTKPIHFKDLNHYHDTPADSGLGQEINTENTIENSENPAMPTTSEEPDNSDPIVNSIYMTYVRKTNNSGKRNHNEELNNRNPKKIRISTSPAHSHTIYDN